MFFRRKKETNEKTILVIDIESGSVGGALVGLSLTGAPKFFSQKRIYFPSLPTRDSASLFSRLDPAVGDVIRHLSHVAARIRHHTEGERGNVSRVVFFLHAPWVLIGIPERGKVSLDAPEELLGSLRTKAEAMLGNVETSFQSFGSRVPPIVGNVFDETEDLILVHIMGEVTELAKTENGVLVSHATIPLGIHTLVRTFGTHAGMKEAEARSALKLLRHDGDSLNPEWREALTAAHDHIMEESKDVIEEIIGSSTKPQRVYTLAPTPLSQWFTKGLTEDDRLASLFPRESSARSLHPHHAKQFLGVHPAIPDLPLSFEALSIQARMSGI